MTIVDAARRDAIADYRILDELQGGELEGLVRLAASICATPTAVINIIDERFQHQVATCGFDGAICAREDSMCAVVFGDGELVAVRDARLDPRFSANPFVTGELGAVRYYVSTPLRMPDGIIIGTLCVFAEDPGELEAAQADALGLLAGQVVDVLELRRVARELERSNEQLAEFAGRVSHDLRNPLAALSGFIELAVESPELAAATDAAEMLGRARSAAGRMSNLLGDLLEYARIGGAQARRSEVDLAQVVADVLDDLDREVAQVGAEVVVDVDMRVFGDATLLGELLQNLVANALKFSAAAKPVPRIEIRAREVDGAVRFTVDDNGPGVPEADRERVFGLMERATSSAPGLGIGLSTCRRIVQAHGGRIGIDDSPLGGASVWVVLPGASAPFGAGPVGEPGRRAG